MKRPQVEGWLMVSHSYESYIPPVMFKQILSAVLILLYFKGETFEVKLCISQEFQCEFGIHDLFIISCIHTIAK